MDLEYSYQSKMKANVCIKLILYALNNKSVFFHTAITPNITFTGHNFVFQSLQFTLYNMNIFISILIHAVHWQK